MIAKWGCVCMLACWGERCYVFLQVISTFGERLFLWDLFFFIYFYNKNTEILTENISLRSFFTSALKQEICLSFIKFLHTITFLTHNNLVLQVTSHTCVRPKIWAVLNIHHRKLKLILSFSARSHIYYGSKIFLLHRGCSTHIFCVYIYTRNPVKDKGKKWGGVVISFCEQIFATQTLQW